MFWWAASIPTGKKLISVICSLWDCVGNRKRKWVVGWGDRNGQVIAASSLFYKQRHIWQCKFSDIFKETQNSMQSVGDFGSTSNFKEVRKKHNSSTSSSYFLLASCQGIALIFNLFCPLVYSSYNLFTNGFLRNVIQKPCAVRQGRFSFFTLSGWAVERGSNRAYG